MILARGDHKVLRLRLLEDEPHALYIVPGISPVAKRIQITQIELVLESLSDAGGRKSNLARHEGLSPTLALMVEEDAVAAVHTVALAVVLDDPEAVEFRHPVRAARIERGSLLLRPLLHEAEKFGGGCLIDAAGLCKPCDAHRLQEAQHADGIRIRRKLRHVEGNLHVALRGEVIDFVRPDLRDDADEAGAVGHIPPMEIDEALLAHVPHPLIQIKMLDAACIERTAAAHDAVHFISFFYQKFGKETAVLTGDTGD